MHVEENGGRPLSIQARILKAPTLRYHESSKQPTIVSVFLFMSLHSGWAAEHSRVDTDPWRVEHVSGRHSAPFSLCAKLIYRPTQD